jgi:undecaprenyl-diphosphatase
LNRKTAAEFSFFLAVPTMFAATAKKMWDSKEILQAHASEYATSLIIGNIVAFVVALFAIKFFIGLVSKSGFKWFGVYRIIVGAFILYWYYTNHSMTIL